MEQRERECAPSSRWVADSGPIDPRVENAPPIDEPFCPRKRRKNLPDLNGVRIVCTHFFKRF